MREITSRETKSLDVPRLAERWRNEPWAWIESNEPYGVKYSAEAAAKRARAKDEFLTNYELTEPRLEYPDIDITEVNDAILRYDTMLFEMHSADKGEQGGYLYESVARKAAELMRLRYVHHAGITNDMEHRADLLKKAVDLSRAIFGEPRLGSVAFAVDKLQGAAQESDSPFAAELLALLPDIDKNEIIEPELISPEAIEALRPIVDEIFAPAIAVIEQHDDNPERSPEEAVVIIQEMIDAMGFTGASALLTEGGALETSGAKLAIELGKNRKAVTNAVLGTTVLHELTHLWGYYTAREADQNTIQGIGMPGTLSSEEGKAGCVEQIRSGKAANRGEVHTLASGLMDGTIDGKKRTFREVHEIMWRRLLVQSGKTDEAAISSAKVTAYGSVMRVYRGGALDTRDLSYGEGNLIASTAFNKVVDLPENERLPYVRFILSHRVNYTQPNEMKLMGFDSNTY